MFRQENAPGKVGTSRLSDGGRRPPPRPGEGVFMGTKLPELFLFGRFISEPSPEGANCEPSVPKHTTKRIISSLSGQGIRPAGGGIEQLDGVQQVGAVVTREFSDWSIMALPTPPPAVWMRVKRQGDTLEVYYSLDGTTFAMLRQAYFPPEPTVQVGVMVCAPISDGFTATFEGFTVRPLETTK